MQKTEKTKGDVLGSNKTKTSKRVNYSKWQHLLALVVLLVTVAGIITIANVGIVAVGVVNNFVDDPAPYISGVPRKNIDEYPIITHVTEEEKLAIDNRTLMERFWDDFSNDKNFRDYVTNMRVSRNNPGNLIFAHQEYSTKSGRFASFQNSITGFRALLVQIQLDMDRGDTLREFVYEYAPEHENNTAQYLKNITDKLGDGDQYLYDIDCLYLATLITQNEHSVIY